VIGTDKKPLIRAFVTTNEFEDGTLGGILIRPDKEGSFSRGILNGVATLTSIALQYGVPLEILVQEFINTRFSPSGQTTDPDIPMASSFLDLLFRKIALKYLDKEKIDEFGISSRKK
jgi:ribonucleoside-diphosphate reductase alpha chain